MDGWVLIVELHFGSRDRTTDDFGIELMKSIDDRRFFIYITTVHFVAHRLTRFSRQLLHHCHLPENDEILRSGDL
jgi:hypothetical protein